MAYNMFDDCGLNRIFASDANNQNIRLLFFDCQNNPNNGIRYITYLSKVN